MLPRFHPPSATANHSNLLYVSVSLGQRWVAGDDGVLSWRDDNASPAGPGSFVDATPVVAAVGGQLANRIDYLVQ